MRPSLVDVGRHDELVVAVGELNRRAQVARLEATLEAQMIDAQQKATASFGVVVAERRRAAHLPNITANLLLKMQQRCIVDDARRSSELRLDARLCHFLDDCVSAKGGAH